MAELGLRLAAKPLVEGLCGHASLSAEASDMAIPYFGPPFADVPLEAAGSRSLFHCTEPIDSRRAWVYGLHREVYGTG
jgi:hypothetical protein